MNMQHISSLLRPIIQRYCEPKEQLSDKHLIPQSRPLEAPPDIGQVRGQKTAKQALLVAAAGRHNLLMIGPPGEGKSFLASTMPSFLPPLTDYQLESLRLTYTAIGQAPPTSRPFRAIGPTITPASLIGGGRGEPIPGELALAHLGVLFIDELPQFPKPLIDSLRQPLEDRSLSVTRNGKTRIYQCDTQLVAAMNPCPCGYRSMYPPPSYTSEEQRELGVTKCGCSFHDIKRYQSKISGPILDRIDLLVWLPPLSSQERFQPAREGESAVFYTKVLQAQCRQLNRQHKLNYRLGAKEIFSPDNVLQFSDSAWRWFKIETDKPTYSTRKTV
jgi:magnesium chelatase family protein